MARPPRLQFDGALYHLMVRANHRQPLFRDHRDRRRYLELLGRYGRQLDYKLYAYLLMNRYARLLMETPRGNVSQVMQRLGTAYTVYFNRRHKRRGPLFEGRYASCLVDKETGLAEATRYIHRDQLRSSLAIRNKRGYPWSSYRFYLRKGAADLVDTRTVLGRFGRSCAERRRRYRRFVEEANGKADGYAGRSHPRPIPGPAAFAAKLSLRANRRPEEERGPSFSKAQRIIEAVSLSLGDGRGMGDLRAQRRRETMVRHMAMYLIRLHTTLPLRAIGTLLGVKAPAVVLAVGKVERLLKQGKFSPQVKDLLRTDRFATPEEAGADVPHGEKLRHGIDIS